MKQVRIGNDIKFNIPLKLTGEAAKVAGDVVSWKVYVRESDCAMPPSAGVIVLNGVHHCDRHHGHCHDPKTELAVTGVTDSMLSAVWKVDKQKLGTYDLLVYAETASGSKGAVDVQRVVQICKHTPDVNDSAAEIMIETEIGLENLFILFAGMSAYDLAVAKGYKGTEAEWLESLKPKVTAEKLGKVTTVYVDGKKVAEIHDGKDGSGGEGGIPDAPMDGKIYGRQNGVWVEAADQTLEERVQTLEDEVDELIAGGVTYSLTVNPSVIFKGVSTRITATATASKEMQEIEITAGGAEIVAHTMTPAKTLTGTKNVSDTTTFSANFQYSGKKTFNKSATVTAVYPIYYGAASAYTDVVNDSHKYGTATTTPARTYTVNVTASGQRVFFVVPSTMTISKATLNGFDFPLTMSSQTISGVAYKVYTSDNSYDAGNINIVIS